MSIAQNRNVQSQNVQDMKPLEFLDKPKEANSASTTGFDFSKLEDMGEMLDDDLGKNLVEFRRR